MQKIQFSIILFCVTLFSLTSCLTDECTDQREFTRFDPVYLKAAEFRTDIETETIKALEEPGKIYYYKDMLFVNQKGQGIHIYDNSDKSNPTFIVFYKILGNFDMAIKDDLLVADNVIDMITIDISDIMNPVIIDRIEDFKSQYEWVENQPDFNYWAYSVPSPVKEVLDCSDRNFNNNQFWRGDVLFNANVDLISIAETIPATSSDGGTGVGGSSARFTVVNDYLYAVDNNSLLSFSFGNGQSPTYESSNNLGWGIETIFPYKENLFIGSNSGMHIFSISNPANPSKLSTFQHARACDPVVVEGNLAYVTLRDGNFCEGFANQLDIIDIADLTNPTLIKSHNMKNPHGLSVDGDKLYLSEGSFGMKVLDVSNSNKLKELAWETTIDSRDLIYLGNHHLMSIGDDGFYQYDVSDPKNIVELSHIPTR